MIGIQIWIIVRPMNSMEHTIHKLKALADGMKSVTALAREIGVRQNTLCRVLRGDNMPSYRTFTAIEAYLERQKAERIKGGSTYDNGA